ncbi:MAG TPA: hypothetical protein VFN21_09840 [Acidimicrobiales bacterium]|nr:hypothetical protein [Acidimicrobiales bacterium]
MPLTEESRHQLFQGLQETLGPDKAATLMDLLPPVGWADVATKRDLDHLGDTLRSEIATLGTELRGEIATLGTGFQREIQKTRAEFFREQRNQAIAIIGANATITGVLLAVFRLL